MSSSSEAAGATSRTAFPGERRVAVATGNRHKLEEIRAALGFEGWEFVAAADLGGWDEPVEDGETFLANARIKAIAAHERFGMAALADDSGLEVDALDGEPGVHSRYYAGPCATDAENNARLLLALGETPPVRREARFRSVMVFIAEDGTEVVAEGSCEGSIAFEPSGEAGFGYDPLFLPDATPGRSMAELSMDEKNAISHRGAALRALRQALEG